MTLTPREMDLARSALQKLPQSPQAEPKRSRKSTGRRKAQLLLFQKANAEYELRKAHSTCRIYEIESEFGLKPKTLRQWRTKRLRVADPTVNAKRKSKPKP